MVTNPALRHIKPNMTGVWCRARENLHALHAWAGITSYSLQVEVFYDSLDAEPGLFADDDGTIVVTHCPRGGLEWAAWLLTSRAAMPLDIEVVQSPTTDPLPLLEPQWPLGDLTGEVAVVGTGQHRQRRSARPGDVRCPQDHAGG